MKTRLSLSRTRCRSASRPGHWAVRARVERFVEPVVLLLLRERAMHGYELIDRLPRSPGPTSESTWATYIGELRALEKEGIVTSEWSAELPGPARRTYELTVEGSRLLERWAEALREAHGVVGDFLDRYEREGR